MFAPGKLDGVLCEGNRRIVFTVKECYRQRLCCNCEIINVNSNYNICRSCAPKIHGVAAVKTTDFESKQNGVEFVRERGDCFNAYKALSVSTSYYPSPCTRQEVHPDVPFQWAILEGLFHVHLVEFDAKVSS